MRHSAKSSKDLSVTDVYELSLDVLGLDWNKLSVVPYLIAKHLIIKIVENYFAILYIY